MDPFSTETISVARQVPSSYVGVLAAAETGLVAALSRITAKTELGFAAEDQSFIDALVNAII